MEVGWRVMEEVVVAGKAVMAALPEVAALVAPEAAALEAAGSKAAAAVTVVVV